MNQFLQYQEILLSARGVYLLVSYNYYNNQRRLWPKHNYQG